MKITIYKCDICGKQEEPRHLVRYKANNISFIGTHNFYRADLCINCITEIKKRVKETKKDVE